MKQENVDAWKEGTDWAFHQRQFESPYKSTIEFANFLEAQGLPIPKQNILDIGAGMGGIIHYFSSRFTECFFSGLELNQECVDRGNQEFQKRGGESSLHLFQGDIFDLPSQLMNKFHGVTCLASLLCFPGAVKPIQAIASLNPEWIGLTSLFSETLVEAQIITKDFSRPFENHESTDKFYNIYSIEKTKILLRQLGYEHFAFQRFDIDIDLPKPSHGGMGTYTERLADGRRLQISGPVLMSWYFILARKS